MDVEVHYRTLWNGILLQSHISHKGKSYLYIDNTPSLLLSCSWKIATTSMLQHLYVLSRWKEN